MSTSHERLFSCQESEAQSQHSRGSWSSIAQIVGGTAVVITLVYLARQIRQNTAAMQAAARNATAAGDVEWLYKLVDCPELGPLFRKEEPLSELEASLVHRTTPVRSGIIQKRFRST